MTRQRRDRRRFNDSPARRLRRREGLAGVALFWEGLWPLLWPPLGVAGLFAAVVLLDLLPALAGWLHMLVLAFFVVAFALAMARSVRLLHIPNRDAARLRLERDSGLDHRPLRSLDDSLASPPGDPHAQALWTAHQAQLRRRLERLKVSWPHPGLAAIDRFALRGALLMVLLIALVVGHGDWRDRLLAALTPQLTAQQVAVPASLDLWINPPPYTGLPPLFLDRAAADAAAGSRVVRVPVGSTLLAQVSGGSGAPSLRLGEEQRPFKAIAAEAYRISLELRRGERIAVVQGETILADWPLELIPDQPPEIELSGPPSRTGRSVLRLDYMAEDDYGIVSVSALIERIDQDEPESFEIELLLPGGERRNIEQSSYHDLTAHPWAGVHVDITLVGKDAIGQTDSSFPARIVLPERIFNHPVARKLVELRKQLTLDPTARLPVVRALSELYKRPAHFYHDLVVALAIRIAERRLIYDADESAIGEIQQLLWDTALHIEEGEFAIAERDLREIQEALMRALESGASDEEIARLMDQLQQALERYLQAMQEQLMEQLAQGGERQPLPPNSQLIDSDQLRDMIDQARQMAQNGARDAARELLEQLRNMLENMQAGLFDQQFSQDEMGAWKMMEQADELMRRQQRLLDQSYLRAQRGPPDSAEGQAQQMQENLRDAQGQESLRRELGEMMRQLGDMLGSIPRPFGRAEQAMRDARDALEEGMPSQAVDPQTRSVDQLQQGMRSMAEQIVEQMANAARRGSGQLGMQPGQGRDPLGRRWGDGSREAIEGVEIPDQIDMQRAREILHELRRRRGDRMRPSEELEYIDRLLRRF